MRVLPVTIILQICWVTAFSAGRPLTPENSHFPLGVIGCLVGDALCGSQEICIDDNLFGVCSVKGNPPVAIPNYDLSNPERISQLESEIMKLLLKGYTWQDTFAQCIIQNLLISEPESSNSVDCSMHKSQPLSSNEKLEDNRLDSIINDQSGVAYKMPYSLSSLPLYKYPKSDKRDEIVHVHKYFDKPAIPSRRASGPPEVELVDNYAEDMYPDESDTQIAESPVDQKNLFMSDEARAPSLERNGITAIKRAGSSDATRMNAEEIRQYLDNLEKLLDTNYSLDKPDEDTETENQAIDTDVQKSGYAVPNVIAERLQGYEPGVNRLSDISYDGTNDNGNVDEDDSLAFAAQLQDSIPIPEETSEELIDSLQGEAQDAPVNPEEMMSDAGAVRLMSILGNKGDTIGSPEEAVGNLGDNTALPEEIVEIPEDTIVPPENTLDNFEDSLADDYEDDEIFTTADAEMLQHLLKGSLSLDSLSDKQMTHINKYVNTLLDAINETDEQPEETNQAVDEDVRDLLKSDKLTPDDAEQLSRVEALMGDSELLPNEDDSQNVFKEPVSDPDKSVIKKASAVKEKTPVDEREMASSSISDEMKNHYEKVDANYGFVMTTDGKVTEDQALKLVQKLEEIMILPSGTFSNVKVDNGQITFRIDPDVDGVTASTVAKQVEVHHDDLEASTGLKLSTAGIGNEVKVVETAGKTPKYYTLTFALCGSIATALLAVVIFYMFKRQHFSRQKMAQLGNPDTAEASKDYQDLCRQKMQSKTSEKPEPLHAAATRIASVSEAQVRSPSSRSSTSSWSEEPVTSNMDISTGHIVLSYMEDHLQNKDRLDQEWEALCAYEADPCSTQVAMDYSNARKNRYSDILPYDHSRVVLNQSANASASDYINASTITDHDPRNPAYIATQGPLPHTVADFWQMVWEQGSVVIVMLTKLTENGEAMCHRYWPEEGSDLYHIYEVHLVSEHIWCDDYLVRSFYLKNLQTNETRTVTQFHFLSWADLNVPTSVKVLLDFRRKVNKSYRGRSCPIVVHCNDGCGRTGTYALMDMVLNRMAKGAKEIDIAATLEHIRDQRMSMVKTKEQFQYALSAVAEEVHAILKALPQ